MTICDRLQIVVVPFPFVDIDIVKPRPAVVLSNRKFNREQTQTIFAMVTTAARSEWPSDIKIENLSAAGLHGASVIRFKLFTLPNARIARVIGRLSRIDEERLNRAIERIVLVTAT